MGMDLGAPAGKKGQHRPEMNVTPLVDVVLVLLIIFMVLTASMNDQFWVHVPEKEQKEEPEPEEADPNQEAPIVVTVTANGQVRINQDVFPDKDFPERLKRMLVARGDRRVYFDAQDGVSYDRAMEVLDLARGGGASHIAVVTEKLQD
jgi:biopolymer transport protein ExbD